MAKKKLEPFEVPTPSEEFIAAAEVPTEEIFDVAKGETSTPSVKTSFDVYNPGGALVRTYTIESHGEDAEKLANEYAGKIGGKVV